MHACATTVVRLESTLALGHGDSLCSLWARRLPGHDPHVVVGLLIQDGAELVPVMTRRTRKIAAQIRNLDDQSRLLTPGVQIKRRDRLAETARDQCVLSHESNILSRYESNVPIAL